jgi:hypothetical protein
LLQRLPNIILVDELDKLNIAYTAVLFNIMEGECLVRAKITGVEFRVVAVCLS